MTQQAQIERTEIDSGGEQFIRLFLYDVAHLRLECERHHQRDDEQQGHRNRYDFQ